MIMRLKLDFNLIAMVLAVITLIEGLVILINAHQVTIHGSSVFTGFAKGTISVAGLQLAIIGAMALIVLWLPLDKVPHVYMRGMMGIGPMMIGVVIIIEGLLVAYFAAPITLTGTDIDIRRDFVAAFGAQLFFLGMGLVSSWIFRSRSSISVASSVLAFVAILSAGLWAASIAELVFWTNFSGFYGRTVFTAGALLMAIGLVGLLLNYFEGKAFLGKPLFDMPMWSWGIVLMGALIGFGSLIGLSLADTVLFATHDGFSGTTVAVAMFSMFILGLLAFLPRFLPVGNKAIFGNKAHMVGIILALLLPFAILV